MKIGIVIADEMEFLPLTESIIESTDAEKSVCRGNDCVTFNMNGHGVTAVKCGIGKVNASTAAAFLIADGAEMILNAGLSGGISGVRRGDIVIGTSFVEADFDLTPLGFEKGEKPGQEHVYEADRHIFDTLVSVCPSAKTGAFGCGDFFLADSAKKEEYGKLFGIIQFDMESGAIASVCKKSGVPFGSIRKVSDDAADTAGDDYTEMNEQADKALYALLLDALKVT